jgi:hypothetical protein
MPCPYLKEVVMLYCDAYHIKKMVPLDRLVSASPCLAQDFGGCPMFQDAVPVPSEPAEADTPGAPVVAPAGREAVR